MNTLVTSNHSSSKLVWLLALILLPVLGWLGVLDNLSNVQINNSISSAGLIYGTARGINALVSLIQGTELNVVFLTVSVGEVLDPVNDLIERFSDFILLALGSLALQKILLAVVSHTTFNIVLTALAAFTGIALFQSNTKAFNFLSKSFLIVAFLRFSLGIVVLANGWVDAHFLNKADEERYAAMKEFKGELDEANSLSKGQVDYSTSIGELQEQLTQIEAKAADTAEEIDALQHKIEKAKSNLETLKDDAGGLCSISARSPSCPSPVKNALAAVSKLESQKEKKTSLYKAAIKNIEERNDALECLTKKAQGENCGFFDRFSNAPNIKALQDKMSTLDDSVGVFASNIIDLLTSILLKSIAIPLLFFYVLLKLARINWPKL